jgi:hypothetical protein
MDSTGPHGVKYSDTKCAHLGLPTANCTVSNITIEA